MNFETEKTVLFYAMKGKKEIKKILPISDIVLILNPENSSTSLIIKQELKDLGQKLKRLIINLTNDPKSNYKFVITNLGYYSTSYSGEDCEVFHIKKGKKKYTMFKFDINKFNIDLNYSIYLPQIKGKSLFNLFDFNNRFKAYYFKFGKTHNEIEISIFEDEELLTFNIDNLKIDDNYKFISKKKVKQDKILKAFGIE